MLDNMTKNQKIGIAVGTIIAILAGLLCGWAFYHGDYSDGKSAGNSTGYTNGFTAGEAKGFNKGNQSGFELGGNLGLEMGNETGFKIGVQYGKGLGLKEGNETGFKLGLAAAKTGSKTDSKTDSISFPEFGIKTAEIIGSGTDFTWASIEGRKESGDLFFKIPEESKVKEAIEKSKLRDNGDNRAANYLGISESEGWMTLRNGNSYQPVFWTSDRPTEVAYGVPFAGDNLPADYDLEP